MAPVVLVSSGAGERSTRKAILEQAESAKLERLTRTAALQTSPAKQKLDKWEQKAQKDRDEYTRSLAKQNSVLRLFEISGPQGSDEGSFEERMARRLRAQLLRNKAASRQLDQVVVFRKSHYMRNCGLAQERRVGGF